MMVTTNSYAKHKRYAALNNLGRKHVADQPSISTIFVVPFPELQSKKTPTASPSPPSDYIYYPYASILVITALECGTNGAI